MPAVLLACRPATARPQSRRGVAAGRGADGDPGRGAGSHREGEGGGTAQHSTAQHCTAHTTRQALRSVAVGTARCAAVGPNGRARCNSQLTSTLQPCRPTTLPWGAVESAALGSSRDGSECCGGVWAANQCSTPPESRHGQTPPARKLDVHQAAPALCSASLDSMAWAGSSQKVALGRSIAGLAAAAAAAGCAQSRFPFAPQPFGALISAMPLWHSLLLPLCSRLKASSCHLQHLLLQWHAMRRVGPRVGCCSVRWRRLPPIACSTHLGTLLGSREGHGSTC